MKKLALTALALSAAGSSSSFCTGSQIHRSGCERNVRDPNRTVRQLYFLTISRHRFSLDRDVAGDRCITVYRLFRLHPDPRLQAFHPVGEGRLF